MDIVNFSIIPTDKIIDKIFEFNNKTSEAISNKYSSLGYKSSNLLKNLGLIILAIVGLSGIIILVLLFKILVNKY